MTHAKKKLAPYLSALILSLLSTATCGSKYEEREVLGAAGTGCNRCEECGWGDDCGCNGCTPWGYDPNLKAILECNGSWFVKTSCPGGGRAICTTDPHGGSVVECFDENGVPKRVEGAPNQPSAPPIEERSVVRSSGSACYKCPTDLQSDNLGCTECADWAFDPNAMALLICDGTWRSSGTWQVNASCPGGGHATCTTDPRGGSNIECLDENGAPIPIDGAPHPPFAPAPTGTP